MCFGRLALNLLKILPCPLYPVFYNGRIQSLVMVGKIARARTQLTRCTLPPQPRQNWVGTRHGFQSYLKSCSVKNMDTFFECVYAFLLQSSYTYITCKTIDSHLRNPPIQCRCWFNVTCFLCPIYIASYVN